jgi:hypothetical protein
MSPLLPYRIVIEYADGTRSEYSTKSRHGVAGAISFARYMRRDQIAKHGGATVTATPIETEVAPHA